MRLEVSQQAKKGVRSEARENGAVVGDKVLLKDIPNHSNGWNKLSALGKHLPLKPAGRRRAGLSESHRAAENVQMTSPRHISRLQAR